MAAGRRVLDLRPGDRYGGPALAGAGAVEVVVPEDAAAAGVERDGFDLATCFGVLERSPAPGAVIDGIERALAPGGLALVSLRSWWSQPDGPEGRRADELLAGLERRFVEVRRFGDGSLVAAGPSPLPALEPPPPPIGDPAVEMLASALDEWEERAREAEAEAAASHWEMRVAGEKLTALVERLFALENSRLQRLRRRLRGQPSTISHQRIVQKSGPGHGSRRQNG